MSRQGLDDLLQPASIGISGMRRLVEVRARWLSTAIVVAIIAMGALQSYLGWAI